ncbi:hypothetical protein ACJ4V0_15480 [Phreatobacter sp. HK31-P]
MSPPAKSTAAETLAAIERTRKADGSINVSAAALSLGVSRSTMQQKVDRLGLPRHSTTAAPSTLARTLIPPLPREIAKEAVDALAAHGSLLAAAAALCITTTTLDMRLRAASGFGLDGSVPKAAVPPEGFVITSKTAEVDKDGEITKQWIGSTREPGEAFALPDGHRVKGVSALLNSDGLLLAQWVKTQIDPSASGLLEALTERFARYEGFAVLPPAPTAVDADLLTVYNIADHHLGLFSWAKETGADYDLKIGEATLRAAMATLVASAPPSETAIVLNLGDFFHADTNENRTAQSGNALDVDTRYAKVLEIGVQLMIDCIEMALQKHARVIVRCLPGNHDPHTALALAVALSAFFRSNDRVAVDCDPSKFFQFSFGRVLIAATHGDMLKPEEMPGYMASMYPKAWGASEFRYAYFGHVHHKSRGGGERHGVVWETFQTLSAKDAWHAGKGYVSGRSMVAITHHRETGEFNRQTVAANLNLALIKDAA